MVNQNGSQFLHTHCRFAQLIGFKALLKTTVALGEVLLLLLQLGLEGEVLLCQGPVISQRPLLTLLDILHLQKKTKLHQ